MSITLLRIASSRLVFPLPFLPVRIRCFRSVSDIAISMSSRCRTFSIWSFVIKTSCSAHSPMLLLPCLFSRATRVASRFIIVPTPEMVKVSRRFCVIRIGKHFSDLLYHVVAQTMERSYLCECSVIPTIKTVFIFYLHQPQSSGYQLFQNQPPEPCN